MGATRSSGSEAMEIDAMRPPEGDKEEDEEEEEVELRSDKLFFMAPDHKEI